MTVTFEYTHGRFTQVFQPEQKQTPVIFARRSTGNTHILFGYDIDNRCIDWMEDTDNLFTILNKWPLVSFIE